MELKFDNCFGDKRLQKRAVKMTHELFAKCIYFIRQIAGNNSSQPAWYRFLRNDNITEHAITKEITQQCGFSVKDRVVLSSQDTSDINLYTHKTRINNNDSIGTTNSPDRGLGFLIHPSLVVDSSSGFPIGFSDIKAWNRPNEKITKHEREYNKLPIQEKESNKWIESS